MQEKVERMLRTTYSKLSAWQKVQVARHPDRPHAQDYIDALFDDYMPLFRWTVTDGLQRLDIALEPQPLNSEPGDVLKHIRAVSKPGIYILLDFHPFLEDPLHVRLLKDICIRYQEVARQIVLISHDVKLPAELLLVRLVLPSLESTEHARVEVLSPVVAWQCRATGISQDSLRRETSSSAT